MPKRGVKHRQLTGVTENQIKAHRQHAEDKSEDQNGERYFIVQDERHGEHRQPEQFCSHRLPPNKPAGRNNKIRIKNIRP